MKKIIKRRAAAVASSLLIASGALVGGAMTAIPSANAALVYNMMKCDPDTGWCYQTNPPYNPAFDHKCQWDYTLNNLWSGMHYTGCEHWGPDIH